MTSFFSSPLQESGCLMESSTSSCVSMGGAREQSSPRFSTAAPEFSQSIIRNLILGPLRSASATTHLDTLVLWTRERTWGYSVSRTGNQDTSCDAPSIRVREGRTCSSVDSRSGRRYTPVRQWTVCTMDKRLKQNRIVSIRVNSNNVMLLIFLLCLLLLETVYPIFPYNTGISQQYKWMTAQC